MPRYTYGNAIKARVWCFLEVLLSQTNAANENPAAKNGVQIDWHHNNTLNNPKLEVRAQLTALARLTQRKLGVDNIREVLSHYLPEFLGILDDKRKIKQGKGSENWHFILEVWHTDLQENQRRFNLEWERKKSGINPVEGEDAIDWLDVCRTRLDNEKRLLTNPLSRWHLYIPLKLVKHQQQPSLASVSFEEILKQKCSGTSQETRLAIAGEPGAGKTRLLLRIAEWILEEKAGVPIWISLGANGSKRLEQYLLEDWLRNAARELEAAPPNWKQAFGELLKSGKVWLLLDGADEMTVESPLADINQQLSQGWAANVRVILTCRLNVWQADNNTLANFFDVYSNLGNDNPDLVREFIHNWFTGNPDKSERLQEELEKPHRESIRDLVKNPLRLAFLCQTWEQRQGRLPQTKARMYQMFVEAFYAWNNKFAVDETQQAQLNKGLGHLAINAIARPDSRFQLPESEIRKVLVNPDLFRLALKLGWLNQVCLATTSYTLPDEKVYAFFHPIFQEYFAAQAIDDWHFFLNHIPPVPPELRGVGGDSTYRIFSPQWKEVMLLWLGRDNMAKEQKEAFIQALVNFEDGSGKFEQHPREYNPGFLPRNRGCGLNPSLLLLAAAGISEFSECSQTREIVAQLVKWAFGYFEGECGDWKKFDYHLANKAAVVLQEICRITVVKTSVLDALIQLLHHPEYYNLSQREAEYLSKIGCGVAGVIEALTHLMRNTHSEDTRCWAAYSLGMLADDKSQAIETLTCLINTTSCDRIRCQAAYSLGKINPGNYRAIQALVELLATTTEDEVGCWAAFGLEKIAVGNIEASAALTLLLHTTQENKVLCLAASSLTQIEPENIEAINCLIHQLLKPAPIRDLAVVCLKRTAKHKSATATHALINFLHTQTEYSACWAAAEVLGKIERGNETAIKKLIELITQIDVLLTGDNIEDLYWRLRTLRKVARHSQEFAIELLKTKAVGAGLAYGTKPINYRLPAIKPASMDENIRYLVSICLQSIAPNHPETVKAMMELADSRDVDVNLIVSTFKLFMKTITTETSQADNNSVLQIYDPISLGTLQLRAGALNPALFTFRRVLKLEPGNIYNRLQLVKLYRKMKRNMEALTMAGFTISLSSEPKVSSQLYNIIGRIFQDEFERGHRVEDGRQAIAAYQSAIDANPNDIVPMWNKVDIHLKLSKSQGVTKEQSQHYVATAKRELEKLKRICFMMQGNCRRYLPKVVKDMKKTLDNADLSPWWQFQLDVLRILVVQIES